MSALIPHKSKLAKEVNTHSLLQSFWFNHSPKSQMFSPPLLDMATLGNTIQSGLLLLMFPKMALASRGGINIYLTKPPSAKHYHQDFIYFCNVSKDVNCKQRWHKHLLDLANQGNKTRMGLFLFVQHCPRWQLQVEMATNSCDTTFVTLGFSVSD